MAASNFQTHKPFPLLLITTTLTFFFLLLNKVNSSEFLAFRMKTFSPQDVMRQGDAVISKTGSLQLTRIVNGRPVFRSLGRALYSTPVHIWSNRTGAVASFATSFSFVIDAPDPARTADGLAFFMAPTDTQPGRGGGFLGLFSNSNYNSSNQIVAVELDTFYNRRWDPRLTPHIGINVNSIRSKNVTSWGFRNGNVGNVLITYKASSQRLVASLAYRNHRARYTVSANVDIKNILPEWIRVGFSATTGLLDPRYTETHEILSWSFASRLPSASGDVGDAGNDLRLEDPVLDESVDLRLEDPVLDESVDLAAE